MNMNRILDWSLAGAIGETIYGNTHLPEGVAKGVILIAHGFKGYKDYGMFPFLAAHAAEQGFIAHRFNFSHSGMTNDIDSFARPDLFEKDTWNKQVEDYRAVIRAVVTGELEGKGLPYVMFGHSRGGVTTLLTAGRMAGDTGGEATAQPAGIITAAAPSRCHSFSEAEQQALLKLGSVESPSSRTGQVLKIDQGWLQEQIDDPASHNVQALVGKIRCPLVFVHGADDPSVPVAAAGELQQAAQSKTEVVIVPGSNHVFNTSNPMPPPEEQPPSEQLTQLCNAMTGLAKRVCGGVGADA